MFSRLYPPPSFMSFAKWVCDSFKVRLFPQRLQDLLSLFQANSFLNSQSLGYLGLDLDFSS